MTVRRGPYRKLGRYQKRTRTLGPKEGIPRIRSPRTKAEQLWRFYRLPLLQYEAWLVAGCAVCGCDLSARTPDVDHDHSCDHPGKGLSSCRGCVRGLLCRSCNLRAGAFERGLNHDSDIAAYLGKRAGVSALKEEPDTLFLLQARENSPARPHPGRAGLFRVAGSRT